MTIKYYSSIFREFGSQSAAALADLNVYGRCFPKSTRLLIQSSAKKIDTLTTFVDYFVADYMSHNVLF